MPFTTIARGGMSQVDSPRTVVVRTPADWTTLWNEHAGGVKPPAVDFSTSMVIAVFSGMKPTGGHSIEITHIEKGEKEIVVTYTERTPGPDDITTQALTFPFHMVRTASHAGPVTFRTKR